MSGSVMKRLAVAALVTSAAACAPNFEGDMQAWNGHSFSELTYVWGTPKSVEPGINGGERVTYKYDREINGYVIYCRATFDVTPAGYVDQTQYVGNPRGCSNLIKDPDPAVLADAAKTTRRADIPQESFGTIY